MELTLSTHLLVYRPLAAAALEAVARGGFPRLEIWLAEPHVPWRRRQDAEQLARFLADHGLSAASVHLPFYSSLAEIQDGGSRWSLIAADPRQRDAALAGAAQGLEAAAALGARRAVLHLGWQRDSWSAEAHRYARQAVAVLLEQARGCGVELLLENIVSAGTRSRILVRLLEELDPDGQAGLCLDLGHANLEGPILQELEDALPRLRHLHVHDNHGSEDEHLAPGRGTIPWPAVIQRLRAAGFAGMGALEVRDQSRGRLDAAEVLAEELPRLQAFREHWREQRLPSRLS